MLEDLLIRHGAPTLAGIKTGNLFPCPYTSKSFFLAEVRQLNHILVPKGVCLLPLQYVKNRVLVYLFRPGLLKKDLSDHCAIHLLHQAGYQGTQLSHCLGNLMQRLRTSSDFPHEIGLFLSYPPEDVQGFIENRARNFKCVGCWKVYGNEQEALKRFAQYKHCTDIYWKHRKEGKGIAELAIAAKTG